MHDTVTVSWDIVIAMRVQFALSGMRSFHGSKQIIRRHDTNANESGSAHEGVTHRLSLKLCIEPHNRLANLILFLHTHRDSFTSVQHRSMIPSPQRILQFHAVNYTIKSGTFRSWSKSMSSRKAKCPSGAAKTPKRCGIQFPRTRCPAYKTWRLSPRCSTASPV